jgi:hypothetical protein
MCWNIRKIKKIVNVKLSSRVERETKEMTLTTSRTPTCSGLTRQRKMLSKTGRSKHAGAK